MAQWAMSLNAVLDGTQQTALIRFTLDDSLVPDFLTYYRDRFTGKNGALPPTATDVQVFKQWARQVIAMMQGEVRRAAEQKTAGDAVGAMPPPAVPVES